MSRFDRIVVAPFDDSLLRSLKGVPVVIRLPHQRQIGAALACARAAHLDLYRLWIDTSTPLCAMQVEECWNEAALALFVPSAGRYKEFQPQLRRLRPLRIRIYLPATTAENLLAVRILAAEGIRSAVILKPPVAYWDALSDLTAYAVGATRHAPIEPFAFLATRYHRGATVDYGAVYFDDPARFLYAGAGGRVAATLADLQANRFLTGGLDDVREATVERHVPASAACAGCAGWGVCLGRFAAEAEKSDHCRRFFTDLIDTIVSTPRAA